MRASEIIGERFMIEAGIVDTLAKGVQAATSSDQDKSSDSSQQQNQNPGMPLPKIGTILGTKDSAPGSTSSSTPTGQQSSSTTPQQSLANKQQQQLTMTNLDKIAAQIVALKQNLSKQQTS
jgi:hypothetical protein